MPLDRATGADLSDRKERTESSLLTKGYEPTSRELVLEQLLITGDYENGDALQKKVNEIVSEMEK